MTNVKQHRAGLRIGAALVGAAILAAGFSGSPSSAGGGGEITMLCGATEEWCEANTSAFTEATGIGASFVRLSDLVKKFGAEVSAPPRNDPCPDPVSRTCIQS